MVTGRKLLQSPVQNGPSEIPDAGHHHQSLPSLPENPAINNKASLLGQDIWHPLNTIEIHSFYLNILVY